MTRDQLEELANRLEEVGTRSSHVCKLDSEVACLQAAAFLRSLLAQEPVFWYSPDKKIIIEAKDKAFWPSATIPLYAAPVTAVDLEAFKAEAMRLADAMVLMRPSTTADSDSELLAQAVQLERARAALQAHLDKLGGR